MNVHEYYFMVIRLNSYNSQSTHARADETNDKKTGRAPDGVLPVYVLTKMSSHYLRSGSWSRVMT